MCWRCSPQRRHVDRHMAAERGGSADAAERALRPTVLTGEGRPDHGHRDRLAIRPRRPSGSESQPAPIRVESPARRPHRSAPLGGACTDPRREATRQSASPHRGSFVFQLSPQRPDRHRGQLSARPRARGLPQGACGPLPSFWARTPQADAARVYAGDCMSSVVGNTRYAPS